MNYQTQTQPQEPVDQTALNLSRSIRKAEGGDYNNVSGDASTSAGAYQFNNGKIPLKKGEVPANFRSWATEEGLDPNDFSPTNQDHVAYSRIKRKLDSGLTQSQIAAEWNSGLTHGWENHVATTTINGQKIHYDTPGYVNKVKAEYERLSGGGSVEDKNTPSPQESGSETKTKGLTFDDIPNDAPVADTPGQEPGIIDNLKKGNIGGAIMKGVNDTTSSFAGLAAIPVQAAVKGYNALTGSNVPDPYSEEGGNTSGLGVTPLTLKDKGTDLLKAGAITAGVASAGLLGSTLSGARVLSSPVITEALPNGMKAADFLKLNKIEQLNILGDMAKTASKAGMEGDLGEIAKAIKYLNPGKSWVKGLLGKGLSKVAEYALIKSLGDTVGGLIHRSTFNK